MVSPQKPLRPLPAGCSELRRTANPDDYQALKDHLDRLPSLNQQNLALLERVATVPRNCNTGTVIGVSDLLRRRSDGSHMLHPRVLQVLSPDVVDSTLNRVVTLCDESIDYAAYQYPDYFIESREGRRKPVLTPEEFSMDFLDAIRDLRANDVVTWTRRRKPSAERIAAVEETVERMEQRGNSVEGVVWLLIAEEESSLEHPVVVIKDRGEITGRRSVEELIHLCETVKTRFRALFTIEPTSEYISSRV